MTATWHTPATWTVGQLVTATNLNEQLRDNLEFLKTPPTSLYNLNQGSDYTTTSTSFVDVDATNLSLTINTAGGDVLIVFLGFGAGSARLYFDIAIDGVRMAGDDGFFSAVQNSNGPLTLVALKQGLSAGSHTFKLQWKVNSGTGTLYAGAGTSGFDVHPQFFVREVS
jgi:hypothetical protein